MQQEHAAWKHGFRNKGPKGKSAYTKFVYSIKRGGGEYG
jgi:hypothetical protein